MNQVKQQAQKFKVDYGVEDYTYQLETTGHGCRLRLEMCALWITRISPSRLIIVL